MTFSDVLTKNNGIRTPTTFDINDVMMGGGGGGGGGGGIMKHQNDVIFSKTVWRRSLTYQNVSDKSIELMRRCERVNRVTRLTLVKERLQSIAP